MSAKNRKIRLLKSSLLFASITKFCPIHAWDTKLFEHNVYVFSAPCTQRVSPPENTHWTLHTILWSCVCRSKYKNSLFVDLETNIELKWKFKIYEPITFSFSHLLTDCFVKPNQDGLKSSIVWINPVTLAGILISRIDFIDCFVGLATSEQCFRVAWDQLQTPVKRAQHNLESDSSIVLCRQREIKHVLNRYYLA